VFQSVLAYFVEKIFLNLFVETSVIFPCPTDILISSPTPAE
jgi:hypothetical protein